MKNSEEEYPPLGQTDSLSNFALSGANIIPAPVVPASSTNPHIYNPGVKGEAVAKEKLFLGPRAEADAKDYAKQLAPGIRNSDIRVVDDGDMCALGDALLTLASRLAIQPTDLSLFPLRAGHLIRRILEGMLECHPPFATVEFSEAASFPNDPFYRERLAQAIRQYNPGNTVLRLAVADVGNSGAGTEKILQLLREVRLAEFPKQAWIVECHVFHEHDNPRRFTAHKCAEANFVAIVETYRTFAGTDLLDRWVAAMGLEKVRRAVPGGIVNIPKIKEVVEPAAIILKSPVGYRAIVSKVGQHAANLTISHYTTEALATSSQHQRRPEFDRWKS